MKANKLLEALKKINKTFCTVSDVELLTRQPRPQVRVALNRLVKQGELRRLLRDVYILKDQLMNAEIIAEQMDATSYLSFESALARYGIVNQVPYAVTLATAKKSKTLIFENQTVIFRKLAPALAGGYVIENGLRVATPEKALLDLMYLVARGKASQSLDELDVGRINKKTLFSLAKKFPPYVQAKLAQAVAR